MGDIDGRDRARGFQPGGASWERVRHRARLGLCARLDLRVRHRARVGLLLVALGLMLPATAGARARQTAPGVYVDPSSPAGQQYAIPLSTARRIGQPGGGLFGSGITPPPGAAAVTLPEPGGAGAPAGAPAAASTSANANGSGNAAGGLHHPASDEHPTSPTSPGRGAASGGASLRGNGPLRVDLKGPGSHGWGLGWMLAAVLLVGGVGALGGQLLARRQRRHETRAE